ncbi:MAG: polymerase subunit epsilon [Novosphingobium lindaniclasticum]|jgi:DNA polymerase-3 subunit epsilon|uniref:DNA polymerase III subunit epsilon n=1 Tax=Novosphingobium lindaniclasticum LE124 TaxID=1096930 RepID=T0HHW8_9SPHN|nr:DNA polymerase III subunit epsilon [Novosphingobium lindaniclasticum]EQB12622.1 DNA polymerase III subunit epsilon [Novosphingobium lindaniclasticum LE124]MDF2637780.1 polymerase subunit epsilon [Novosphingobium lindaniclasticum]
MREIIFDTETTGFDPRNGDRMVEIGCIEMINRVPTGQTYHAYFNPERTMPAEAEAVHGLSDDFLADKPLFAHCAQDFVAFIGDAPMIAHNASFDFNFINFELAKCGLPEVCLTRMVDTVALAKVRHPGAKLSLDALCTRYGIDRSHRTKHGALLDAELLAQVYVELRGGRQIGLELLAETAEATTESRILIRKDRPFRQPRPHAATEEELLIHAEFLKSVDAPLWGA